MAVILKGWRFAVFLGVIVGGIGLTLYPVVIDPMISADKYSKWKNTELESSVLYIWIFVSTEKIKEEASKQLRPRTPPNCMFT